MQVRWDKDAGDYPEQEGKPGQQGISRRPIIRHGRMLTGMARNIRAGGAAGCRGDRQEVEDCCCHYQRMIKIPPMTQASDTSLPFILLRIIEVDPADRVQCQCKGCGHGIYAAIHMVLLPDDEVECWGSDC